MQNSCNIHPYANGGAESSTSDVDKADLPKARQKLDRMIPADGWIDVELRRKFVANVRNRSRLIEIIPDCRSDALEAETTSLVEVQQHDFTAEFTRNLACGFLHDRRARQHTHNLGHLVAKHQRTDGCPLDEGRHEEVTPPRRLLFSQ